MRAFAPLALVFAVALAAGPADARNAAFNAWQDRYGASSESANSAECQLCHVLPGPQPGRLWNGYGFDFLLARANAQTQDCDDNGDGSVTFAEAFVCIELLDSDGQGDDNVREIGLSTQPGWREGDLNTHYDADGAVAFGQPAPAGIGRLDPDSGEPPPPPPPPPPDDEPKKLKNTIVVKPGDSIQAALDRVKPYGRVLVLPGVYEEPGNTDNALNITKNGIRLIGKSKKDRRVVLKRRPGAPVGAQVNGIAVTPPEHTECLDCHTDLAPPFPRRPGVPDGMLQETDPWVYDVEIRGITIEGFPNNGLFTNHVDGFKFIDVASVENKNYGIFPILSRNGLISHSYASGSDDSGIWVETSENVLVTHNLVEENVNGFEVSNSDDILLAHNVARRNTVGMAILLLPDIFDDRPGAKRIDLKHNHVHSNNKDNSARPGTILATVPKGTGILILGTDDAEISGNVVVDHEFTGIAVADYCAAVIQDPRFNCDVDPDVINAGPAFIADQAASNNRIVNNTVLGNGFRGVPPFGFLAADLTELSLAPNGTCYQDNDYGSWRSAFLYPGGPPACEP